VQTKVASPSRCLIARLSLVVVLGVSPFVAACGAAHRPFTHELRRAHDLEPSELARLQFYVSDTITLRREVNEGSRAVSSAHRLVLIEGKTVEEVVIPAGTPGVVAQVDDGALDVSFEPGEYLRFRARSRRAASQGAYALTPSGPNPFPGNPAPDPLEPFHGDYTLELGSTGKVTYGGREFDVVVSVPLARLLVASEELARRTEQKKVVRGMKLD
jgi:hypothetical protein